MLNNHLSKFIAALIMVGQFNTATAMETYAVIGDAGKATANAAIVRQSIGRLGVHRLILPGDNLYSGTYQNVWKPWRDLGMQFDIVAIGNHNGGYKSEMAYFGMPSEYYTEVDHETRFIVLNSDNNNTGKEQAQWLEQVLSKATEPFIFLVYHHPSYTISKVHTWQEKKNFQLAIRPLIWKYRPKLTALLVGHDHLASILHFNDLPVILSGAVQEVRSDKGVNNTQENVTVKTAWYFDSTPHWAKLSLFDASTIQVNYVRGKDDKVTCTALIQTGKAAKLQSNCKGK